MKVGVVIGDSDIFYRELEPGLAAAFDLDVFAGRTASWPVFNARLNRRLRTQDMSAFKRSHDVLFFEWASEQLVFASRLPKTGPVVARLHSYELYAWAEQINWDFVDKVVLVSQAMRRRFLELFPDRAAQTCVVNYGKDLQRYQPLPRGNGNVVGMLCGIVPIKRVYEAVLVIGELRAAGVDIRLQVGGIPGRGADNVRYHKAVLRLVQRLRLGDSVVFSGQVMEPAVWLADIDIFLSNSYWEGQQNAMLEAMATGCPCLAHAWDGAEEVVPTDCMFMSVGELKEKLVAFIALPQAERAAQGARMRKIAEERFDLTREIAELTDIIRQLAT
jgi:glycosyltransferase involved in cell wall biosynthesis